MAEAPHEEHQVDAGLVRTGRYVVHLRPAMEVRPGRLSLLRLDSVAV